MTTTAPFSRQVPLPSVPKPKNFGGLKSDSVRHWIRQADRYVNQDNFIGQFADDKAKILILSQFFEKGAADWFIDYEDRMEDDEDLQDFQGFLDALKAEYGSRHEADDALREIKALKYSKDAGGISALAREFRRLNKFAGLSGAAFQREFKEKLTQNDRDRFSRIPFDAPLSDNLFLEKMVEVVRNREAFDTQESTFRSGGGQGNASGGNSSGGRKGGGKGASTPATETKPKTNASGKGSQSPKKGGKGSNQASSGAKTDRHPNQDKFDKIPKHLRDKRFEKRTCTICDKEGHKWRDCRLQPVVAAAATVAGVKRETTDDSGSEEEDASPKKKRRNRKKKDGAAVAAVHGSSTSSQGRIFEIYD